MSNRGHGMKVPSTSSPNPFACCAAKPKGGSFTSRTHSHCYKATAMHIRQHQLRVWLKSNPGCSQTAVPVVSRGSTTHSEESVIYPLLHTWARRCLQLPTVALSIASFALLAPIADGFGIAEILITCCECFPGFFLGFSHSGAKACLFICPVSEKNTKFSTFRKK